MRRFFCILIIIQCTLQIAYAQGGWFQQSSGVNAILRSVYFINENTGLAVGTAKIRTTNGGLNWVSIFIPYDSYDIQFVDSNTGFIVGFFKPVTLQKSTNAGLNWTGVTYPAITGYPYLSMKFLNPNTGFINSWKTTNGGLNWVDTSPNQSMRGIFFLNENTGWGCSIYGNVLRTTNSGTNWVLVNVVSGASLNAIFFIDENTGWTVSGASKVYKSSNGGINWAMVYNQGLCGLNTLYFVNSQTGWVAGCEGAINKTTNGGTNWTLQTIGTTTSINDIHFINENTGWAVGENGVILRTTTGGITSINQISNEIPDNFSLSQNYPNPFNPATRIMFNIPLLRGVDAAGGQGVLLMVYDILGREITTLVNQNLSPGTYEVEWDASNYPSGVYYYRIITVDASTSLSTGFTETKKMILLR